MNDAATPLSGAELGKLQWRSRRGLLENDLLLQRFYSKYGQDLTQEDAQNLMLLMDLSDNDLLDLFLARKEPQGDLASPGVRQLLQRIRLGAQSVTP